jgi:hypothetical protein
MPFAIVAANLEIEGERSTSAERIAENRNLDPKMSDQLNPRVQSTEHFARIGKNAIATVNPPVRHEIARFGREREREGISRGHAEASGDECFVEDEEAYKSKSIRRNAPYGRRQMWEQLAHGSVVHSRGRA